MVMMIKTMIKMKLITTAIMIMTMTKKNKKSMMSKRWYIRKTKMTKLKRQQ